MIRKAETIAMTILLAAVYCNLALGEATQTTLLRIDIQDYVPYNFDVFDIQKFATGPTLTPWADPGRPTFQSLSSSAIS